MIHVKRNKIYFIRYAIQNESITHTHTHIYSFLQRKKKHFLHIFFLMNKK